MLLSIAGSACLPADLWKCDHWTIGVTLDARGVPTSRHALLQHQIHVWCVQYVLVREATRALLHCTEGITSVMPLRLVQTCYGHSHECHGAHASSMSSDHSHSLTNALLKASCNACHTSAHLHNSLDTMPHMHKPVQPIIACIPHPAHGWVASWKTARVPPTIPAALRFLCRTA